MSDELSSSEWFRVAKLKPKLHDHVIIHRHDYRGLIWYLFENSTTGRSHRFNSTAYEVIGAMDGIKTVQDIYDALCSSLEDFAPGQPEVIDLMSKLYSDDLIKSDATNIEALLQRRDRTESSQLLQRFSNPIVLRMSLWDPDDFLNKHLAKVKWLFNGWSALAWCLLMVYAALEAAISWVEITSYFQVNALSPYNLLLLVVLYPCIKFMHELGHGFSAKLEGGEVHDMGVSFMLFMPIPYVNVSTAAHFRSRLRRILVSAAGILVESTLAAVGLLFFLAAEPGLVKSIGFNIFMIAGISSLFFNGNPLLKYDGYYMLADAISIPNLYQRSSQYWIYLIKRYVFAIPGSVSPVTAQGEVGWFAVYGVLSCFYRLAVLWFILSLVLQEFFYIGVGLAAWLIGLQVFKPLFTGLKFVLNSPVARRQRMRSVAILSTFTVTLTILLAGVEVSSTTVSEGVVWQQESSRIIAGSDGFVSAVHVSDSQEVALNSPLLSISDFALATQIRISQAKQREMNAQLRASRAASMVQAGILQDQIQVAESEVAYLQDKLEGVEMTAFKAGRVTLFDAEDLPGRYVRKGDLLGFIDSGEKPTIKMLVKQDNIGQFRTENQDVAVRFASLPHLEIPAEVIRQSPEATNMLPSGAFATIGGGQLLTDRTEPNAWVSLEKVFVVDLELMTSTVDAPYGSRVYVRIRHGHETVLDQFYRRFRQVFLRQFNV